MCSSICIDIIAYTVITVQIRKAQTLEYRNDLI